MYALSVWCLTNQFGSGQKASKLNADSDGGNMEKSIYESIYPEDSKQFRELATKYMKITVDTFPLAFEVMKDSWALAQRWSDIQSNVDKVAKEMGIRKTDLRDWAYQHYRQLQYMHESSRMIWGIGEREARDIEKMQRGN